MPAPREALRQFIRGKAIPQAIYGSAVEIVPKTAAKALAAKVCKVAWGRTFAQRAPEIVHAVVLDPHAHHPYWASVVACITDIARVIARSPQIAQKYKRILELRTLVDNPHKGGLVANLQKAAKALGITVSGNLTLNNPNGESVPLAGQEIRWLKKKVEEAARDQLVDNLRQRCTEDKSENTSCRKDFRGVVEQHFD